MCDTTFTFGQRGNHYFQCPSHQEHICLPKKLARLLSSSQVQKVHHIALGHESSFLLTYHDKTGHDHIVSDDLPSELEEFIYARSPTGQPLRNIPLLRVALGPYNSSFFAHDSSSYLWLNLPPRLLEALQSRISNNAFTDRPRLVLLGADSDFVLLTAKNAAVWALSHYVKLASMLQYAHQQERGVEEITNIALHPYRYQCFVAQSRNGMLISQNVPEHEVAGLEGMKEAVLRDTQEADRRENERRERERSGVQRRPSRLQHAATLRREWGERKHEFKAQANGLRLSLSLSVSAAGLAGGLGKMLG